MAEAHFLRAYYYTWLWKLWGNIPYYTVNPSTSPYLVEQISADEVYPKIIEDLDYALGENRLPESVDITMKGRVTKAVAQMLKAEVVMYQTMKAVMLKSCRICALLYLLSCIVCMMILLECGKMQANGVKNLFGK